MLWAEAPSSSAVFLARAARASGLGESGAWGELAAGGSGGQFIQSLRLLTLPSCRRRTILLNGLLSFLKKKNDEDEL